MILEKYKLWLESPLIDEINKKELEKLSEKEIEDSFYKTLEFGTGGLRGIIGIGPNRMNIYTVRHATQGLSNFLKKSNKNEISAVIAYDSRNMSKEFALEAALTFADNGIKTFLFSDLRTTPELSFAVRHLGCDAGLVITASHNPKEYNGYKVYGSDGCQITTNFAKNITEEIRNINILDCQRNISKVEAIRNNKLVYIDKDIDESYIDNVKSLSNKNVKPNAKIVYTPIHGTGLMPIQRVLNDLGYDNLLFVKNQMTPDGNFPTVKSPNPEEKEALEQAIKLGYETNADIVIGTDPDCDRVGISVRHKDIFHLLNGNQIGALLIYYMINSGRNIPNNAAVIKTIVTSELGANIAQKNGIKVFNTLTGFKYIGEMIGGFEKNQDYNFLFGYEESYGFLSGDFVRDKDAVIATLLIVEMTSYYKERNLTLIEVLDNIYEEYGYFIEKLKTITLAGIEGAKIISKIMNVFKDYELIKEKIKNVKYIEDYSQQIIIDINDYGEQKINLPKSDVIKCIMKDNSWIAVRPSGTEPKIKFYFSALGKTQKEASNILSDMVLTIDNIINEIK